MKNWMRVLPLFILKVIAKKYCEKVVIDKTTYVIAFNDTLIKL